MVGEPTLRRNIAMKLRKLHIEDYKMFKDFDIDFLDENYNPLDIVVLAGVNGSGKTTLLEFIKYFSAMLDINQTKNNLLEINYMNSISQINLKLRDSYELDEADINQAQNALKIMSTFLESVIYFPSGIDDTKKVTEEFVKTFYFFLKEKDYRPSEITEYFNQYMKDIFNDLDIGFKYSHLDKEDNVWFTSSDRDGYYYTHKDNEEKVLFTIDELSTGQKTLLSKILYIYFKDYKDKVILIDEPELSLHPKWQSEVLSVYETLAEKNNCQIIIATHSPHIIASANNESIRFLEKNDEGNIRAMNDIQAYGRDIEWVLQQMGVEDTRLPKITKRFEEIQALINSQEFDKADEALDKLEYVIGENDKDILALRNDLAFERMDFEEDN